MNRASVDSAVIALRRARRAAAGRATRAAMTPTQRSLSLQRRRDRYRSRRDTLLPAPVPVGVSFDLPPSGSISSLGAGSLAAPSVLPLLQIELRNVGSGNNVADTFQPAV